MYRIDPYFVTFLHFSPLRSYRTILCLQYPAEKLAISAIWLANELVKGEFGKVLEVVSDSLVDVGARLCS